ncbi:hypothetical protein RHGRI_021018 [Rhododendron griersonianum]|uniref:RNase H type-1 domain-containing protein n=1 Tax=Rhododendron griersonianum TaxID=479676 RepID=A0AAV6JMZ4_9ERIC|nr:hypothetical protein RHGRI_021018 [Rhododendron griersonianum]
MAVDAKHLELKVYGDSMLIINQLLDIYEVRKPELVPFNNYARRLIAWLGDVTLEHVPRGENRQADALAKLASTLALLDHETHVPICRSWVIPPIFESEDNGEREVNVVSVLEIETEDWRQPFIDYLQHGKLPDDPHRRTDSQSSNRDPMLIQHIFYANVDLRRSKHCHIRVPPQASWRMAGGKVVLCLSLLWHELSSFVGDGTRLLSCLRLLLLNPSDSMDDDKRYVGLLCMNPHVARMIVEGRIAPWLAFALGSPTSRMTAGGRVGGLPWPAFGMNPSNSKNDGRK